MSKFSAITLLEYTLHSKRVYQSSKTMPDCLMLSDADRQMANVFHGNNKCRNSLWNAAYLKVAIAGVKNEKQRRNNHNYLKRDVWLLY